MSKRLPKAERLNCLNCESARAPKKGSMDVALKRIRAAGGKAWDKIADPEAYVRRLRGKRSPRAKATVGAPTLRLWCSGISTRYRTDGVNPVARLAVYGSTKAEVERLAQLLCDEWFGGRFCGMPQKVTVTKGWGKHQKATEMPRSRQRMASLNCMRCGKFVRRSDVLSGKARHVMLTPDSHVSSESWDTLCAQCNKAERSKTP